MAISVSDDVRAQQLGLVCIAGSFEINAFAEAVNINMPGVELIERLGSAYYIHTETLFPQMLSVVASYNEQGFISMGNVNYGLDLGRPKAFGIRPKNEVETDNDSTKGARTPTSNKVTLVAWFRNTGI